MQIAVKLFIGGLPFKLPVIATRLPSSVAALPAVGAVDEVEKVDGGWKNSPPVTAVESQLTRSVLPAGSPKHVAHARSPLACANIR